METKLKSILCTVLLAFVFAGCDLFEMRGFILSYETVNERFEQSMEWNTKNPYREITIAEDNYSVFVMSDSHVGGVNNLNHFNNEAIKSHAIAAVMVGDLTTGHAKDYTTFYQNLPTPDSLLTFQMVGNHDLYFDGWKTFYSLFGSSVYLFKVTTGESTDLFVCLDSGGGTFGSKQLQWLEELLKSERQDYRHCLLFTHNNLFRSRHTTSTNPFVEEVRVIMKLCIEHQVDMFITGHDHKKDELTFGNTTYLTTNALHDDYKDAGYLKLTIGGEEIDFDFIKLK